MERPTDQSTWPRRFDLPSGCGVLEKGHKYLSTSFQLLNVQPNLLTCTCLIEGTNYHTHSLFSLLWFLLFSCLFGFVCSGIELMASVEARFTRPDSVARRGGMVCGGKKVCVLSGSIANSTMIDWEFNQALLTVWCTGCRLLQVCYDWGFIIFIQFMHAHIIPTLPMLALHSPHFCKSFYALKYMVCSQCLLLFSILYTIVLAYHCTLQV